MEELGEGSYGTVYKDGDNAVKRCFYSGSSVWMSNLREMDILHKFNDHPNIVKLNEVKIVNSDKGKGKDKETLDKILLVMEYVPTSLHKVIPKEGFEMSKVKEIMAQILLALEYIHAKRVIHRDLKPNNILYDEKTGKIKICDFGMSEIHMNYSTFERDVTTPIFRAPEVFAGRKYSEVIDIWAAGCIMFNLITGSYLINVEKQIPDREMLEIQKNINLRKIFKSNHDYRNLLEHLLELDPRERCSAKVALNSRFFDSVRSTIIDPTRKAHPPLDVMYNHVSIEDIPERTWCKEIIYNFMKNFNQDDNILIAVIFHGLEIFDRYLTWAKEKSKRLKKEENNGKYLTKKETFLYLYTCLYISHKWYCTAILPIPVKDFFHEDLLNPEFLQKAEEFEEVIIKEVCDYSPFQFSLYEIAEEHIVNPTYKQYLDILNIYFGIKKWHKGSYRQMFREYMASKSVMA